MEADVSKNRYGKLRLYYQLLTQMISVSKMKVASCVHLWMQFITQSLPHQNSHILRTYMHYMHLCGLLCLPNFYRDPRKNSWHRVYSGAVLSLLGVYSVSITASLVLFAVNDLGEFCERLYEVLCVYICLLDLFFMRWNMDKYMDIVDIFETFERSHASNAILTRFQRTLNRILRVFFVVIFAMIVAVNIIPLVPKSQSSLDWVSRIYRYSHPQNTFDIPLYIPRADPSEPCLYACVYCALMYVAFLFYVIIGMSLMYFPCCAYIVKCYTDVLADFASHIGGQHFTADGHLIYYTNLFNNTFIVSKRDSAMEEADMDPVKPNSVKSAEGSQESNCVPSSIQINMENVDSVQSVDPDCTDYFYVKQVILFQKKLISIREKIDALFAQNFRVRILIGILLVIVSVLASLFPGSMPPVNRAQTILEVLALLVGYMVMFHCAETLAACNDTLRTTAWCSQWYQCSNHTKRILGFFLRMNQKLKHIVIFKILLFGYTFMIGTFRLAWTLFHLMIHVKRLSSRI
ncbi:hypothetical protein M8J77_009297 [Diaphorina citri]|nr:hypothetical protein M8J77_009297 [Diaphorina citri]